MAFGDIFFSGLQNINAARDAGREYGNDSLKLADQWSGELSDLYQPQIDQGLANLQNTYNQTDLLRQGGVPQYQNYDTGGLESLYSNYMNQSQLPAYMQTNAPQNIDYDNAQNTDLYSQLMANSQNAAGSNLPTGMNADIAAAANRNSYDISDRLYNDQLNQYNQAQQNNQYRNQQIDQRLGMGTGLEQMIYEMGQGDYQNQMNQYGAERQQLSDYLNQLGYYSDMGNTATDTYAKQRTQLLGSQTGTLSGMANNAISGLGQQVASQNQMLGNMGSAMGGFAEGYGKLMDSRKAAKE